MATNVMDRVYNNALEHVYENGEDCNVRKYKAYGKAADHKLYYTSDYTTQVTQADAEDAMKKGMLQIIDDIAILVPVNMTNNKVVTVGGTASAATLDVWTTVATV